MLFFFLITLASFPKKRQSSLPDLHTYSNNQKRDSLSDITVQAGKNDTLYRMKPTKHENPEKSDANNTLCGKTETFIKVNSAKGHLQPNESKVGFLQLNPRQLSSQWHGNNQFYPQKNVARITNEKSQPIDRRPVPGYSYNSKERKRSDLLGVYIEIKRLIEVPISLSRDNGFVVLQNLIKCEARFTARLDYLKCRLQSHYDTIRCFFDKKSVDGVLFDPLLKNGKECRDGLISHLSQNVILEEKNLILYSCITEYYKLFYGLNRVYIFDRFEFGEETTLLFLRNELLSFLKHYRFRLKIYTREIVNHPSSPNRHFMLSVLQFVDVLF